MLRSSEARHSCDNLFYHERKKPSRNAEVIPSFPRPPLHADELTIPFGQTITYGEIASRIAKQRGIPRMSAQAVGGAVGHNPIALIIPCHRVVGSNGSLTGYAGGIDKKEQLLRLEQVDMSRLFVPKRGTKL